MNISSNSKPITYKQVSKENNLIKAKNEEIDVLQTTHTCTIIDLA